MSQLVAGVEGVVLRVSGSAVVRGLVLNSAGAPVAGAFVRVDEKFAGPLTPQTMSRQFTVRQALRTELDGTFAAQVLEGDVRVWAREEGGTYSDVAHVRVTDLTKEYSAGTVRLPAETRHLSLRVIDDDGHPIQNAGAMLEYHEYVSAEASAGRSEPYWHLQFDDTGAAVLPFDPARTVLVLAIGAPGYDSVTVCIDRSRVDNPAIDIVLPRLTTVEVRFVAQDTSAELLEIAARSASVALLSGSRTDAVSRASPVLVFPPDTEPSEKTWGDIAPVMRARAAASRRAQQDKSTVTVTAAAPGACRLRITVPFIGTWVQDVQPSPLQKLISCDIELPRLRPCALVNKARERMSLTVAPAEEGGADPAMDQGTEPNRSAARTWAVCWVSVSVEPASKVELVCPATMQFCAIAQQSRTARGPTRVFALGADGTIELRE